MGKRIEELPIDDTPIVRGEDNPDVRGSAWYRVVSEIQDLREDGAHLWAEETLAGIQETIAHTRRVTDGQRRAIDNIAQGGAHRWGRRYDGFRRG